MEKEKVMLSVNETSTKTGLSKKSLRELCATNKINYVRSGKKFLINYNKLVEQLNNNELKEV